MHDVLSKHASSGAEVDMQTAAMNFTLESIGKIAFGVDFGVFCAGYVWLC